MHMGIFYYVICLGALFIFTLLYMRKNWTEEMFEKLADKE